MTKNRQGISGTLIEPARSRTRPALRTIKIFLFKAFRLSQRQTRPFLVAFFIAFSIFSLGLSQFSFHTAVEDLAAPHLKSAMAYQDNLKGYQSSHEMILTLAAPDSRQLTVEEFCKVQRVVSGTHLDLAPELRLFAPWTVHRSQSKEMEIEFPLRYPILCDANSRIEDQSQIINFYTDKLFKNLLFSPTQNDLSIIFSFDPATEQSNSIWHKSARWGSLDFSLIQNLKIHLDEQLKQEVPQLKILWFGNAIFQSYSLLSMFKLLGLNFFVTLSLIALCYVFFGTFRSGFFLVFQISIACIMLFSLMGIFNIPLDLLTVNLALILALSTLEDFVFLSQLQQRYPHWHWRKIFRIQLLPSFFTSLTTVIGFFSLTLSALPSVRYFGFFGGLGVLLEWGICLLLVPALLKIYPSLRCWTQPPFQWLSRQMPFIEKYQMSRFRARMLLVVFPLFLAIFSFLKFEDKPEKMFTKRHPISQAYEYFNVERKDRGDLTLLFPNLDQSEDIKRILKNISKLDRVSFIEDPFDFIDDLKKGIPANFQSIVERPIFLRENFSRYFGQNGELRAFIHVNSTEVGELISFSKTILELCAPLRCVLSGSTLLYAEFTAELRQTLFSSLAIAFLIIGLILCFLAHQTHSKNASILILTMCWGPVLVFTVMILLGIPVSFVTCIFGGILMGLAGDNAIQFLLNPLGDTLSEKASQYSIASFIISVMMCALALLLVLSDFQSTKVLGLLLAGGFLANFAGDYLLLKGLTTSTNKATLEIK